MVILKTWIKILFLLALCAPIIYLQFCIIKNTAKGVFEEGKHNGQEAELDNDNQKYYRREYLRVAK